MHFSTHELARMMDFSAVQARSDFADIKRMAEGAKRYQPVAVFALPAWTAVLRDMLQDSPDIAIGGVVGFPSGGDTTSSKVRQAQELVALGCQELDMVINIEKMLSRDFDYVQSDVKAVVDVAHAHKVLVKVILENHYLTSELIEIGSRLCEQAGADWVKTSSGFAETGATLEDLKLMRKTVSDKVQVKAAGGVRDLDAVLAVREIGVTRFGCTRTPEIMAECYKRKGGKS